MISVALLTVLTTVTLQAGRRTLEMPDDYELDVSRIREAARAGDLPAAEAVVADAATKWAERDPAACVRLLRIACDEVRSRVFADRRRAGALLESWAATAIAKAGDTQFDVQMHLLNCCLRARHRPGFTTADEWRLERRKSAALWIDVWSKLEASIDPAWSLNDPKYEIAPYQPPAGVRFRAGMDPKDIGDPKVREEYTAHLKRNRQLTDFNKQQESARRLVEEHAPHLEEYLSLIYSVPPDDRGELESLLGRIKNVALKQKILAAVGRNAGRP